MRTAQAIPLLLICVAAGAWIHHIFGEERRSIPQGTHIAAAPGSEARTAPQETPGLPERLDKLGGAELRIALDDTLPGLPAEGFPQLVRQLSRVRGDRWLGNSEIKTVIIEYWAAADPAGLLAFASKESNQFPLYSVVAACACSDPAAVLVTLRRLDAGDAKNNQRDQLWETAVGKAGRLIPGALLAAAEREGALDGEDSTHFKEAASAWGAEDGPGAVALGQKHLRLLLPALLGWASRDIDAALAWMKQSGTAETDPDYYQDLIQQYAKEHPKEAGRFRGEVEREVTLDRSIAEGMVRLFPDEALPFIEKGWNKNALYRELALSMTRRPPAEAVAFLKAVPEEMRKESYAEMCQGMAYYDPAAAVAFCSQLPELLSDRASDTAFISLARKNAEAAVPWMKPGKLPDELRERVLPAMIDAWMVMDREAAMRYVKAQPPSELMGRILLDASRVMGDLDNEGARDYAMALTDPALRTGACRRIIEYGFGDGSAVKKEQWIAGIPDAAVRKALRTPPPPPPEEKPPEEAGDPFEDPFAPRSGQ